MAAKFKIKDSVFYPHLNRYGTIKSVINKNDSADVAMQGYRFEVYFDGYGTWSILESSLLRRNENEKRNVRSKQAAIAKT